MAEINQNNNASGLTELLDLNDAIIAPVIKNGEVYKVSALSLKGDPGVGDYVYVGWASNTNGANFSLTPSESLKYRAEIHSSTELTPVEADFNGANWVKYIHVTDNLFNETPSGAIDGANTDFVLSKSIVAGGTRVYLNGIRQKLGSAYTEGAAQVSFYQAPQTGDELIVDILSDENSISNETPTGTVDGTNTDFTLANNPTETEVYLNGIRQKKATTYTVMEDVITFSEAPYAGDEIIVDYKY